MKIMRGYSAEYAGSACNHRFGSSLVDPRVENGFRSSIGREELGLFFVFYITKLWSGLFVFWFQVSIF